MSEKMIGTKESSGNIATDVARGTVVTEYGDGNYVIELLGSSRDDESDVYSFKVKESLWQEPINLIVTLGEMNGEDSVEFFPMRRTDIQN
jgi:hypothetical protein